MVNSSNFYDSIINSTNEWFIERILVKNNIIGAESNLVRFEQEKVSLSLIRRDKILIPKCDPSNYIAFRVKYKFTPTIGSIKLHFNGQQFTADVNGIFVLPKQFKKGIRTIYSTRLLMENYPTKIPGFVFPYFSFPLRGIHRGNMELFKDPIKDVEDFKIFLNLFQEKFQFI